MNAQTTLDLEEPKRCRICGIRMPGGVLIGPTGGTWHCENTHLWEPRRVEHAYLCPSCSEEKNGR